MIDITGFDGTEKLFHVLSKEILAAGCEAKGYDITDIQLSCTLGSSEEVSHLINLLKQLQGQINEH